MNPATSRILTASAVTYMNYCDGLHMHGKKAAVHFLEESPGFGTSVKAGSPFQGRAQDG